MRRRAALRTLTSTVARAALIALPLTTVACAGEASVAYRGSVATAPVAGHAFRAGDAPPLARPLAGARVQVDKCGSYGADGCATRTCTALPPDTRAPNIAVTDAEGRFAVDLVFPGFMFQRDTILVCVEHPDHEPYVYRTPFPGSDPRDGSRSLDVTLKARSAR